MRRKLASTTGALFGGRLIGAGCAFLLQALMARLWGPALLGEYLSWLAAINVVATVMPLGFQVVGGYFAAEYSATASRRSLRAYLVQAYLQTFLMAAAIAGAALVAMSGFGLAPSWRDVLLPSFPMAMACALIYTNGAVLVGLKRPIAGLAADILLRPLLALGAFALVSGFGAAENRLPPMLWMLSGGFAAIAVAQTFVVLRALRSLPPGAAPDAAVRRKWWRYAFPWAVIALATDFFFDIDMVLLSHSLSREELAVFGVAARICSLLAFGIGTIYTVMMPDILEAGIRRNEGEFRRRIEDANIVAAGLAAVLAAAMFLSGPLLALLFGQAFAEASLPLGVMAIGLVVRAIFGPAPLILSFYDRPSASVPAAAAGLVALFAANAILVPPWGLTGAAIAATLAMTLWALVLWLTARRDLNMDVSVAPRLKAIIAGLRSA